MVVCFFFQKTSSNKKSIFNQKSIKWKNYQWILLSDERLEFRINLSNTIYTKWLHILPIQINLGLPDFLLQYPNNQPYLLHASKIWKYYLIIYKLPIQSFTYIRYLEPGQTSVMELFRENNYRLSAVKNFGTKAQS